MSLGISLCCARRVPEAQQWLGPVLTTYFMAQAHYIMAYLAMAGSDPKWQSAAKIFHGAYEDFQGADGQLASGQAAGTSVLSEFRCGTLTTVRAHQCACLGLRHLVCSQLPSGAAACRPVPCGFSRG